ncbi:hypothetical protein P7C71_g1711, partial [Lecanoromycetidae sp. Uapishka_2]
MASLITSYGTVSSSSGKLYYEQEGNKDGPAVLFIHGLGGTTNTYQPLVSALQEFNLVRFDWAGHGRSSLPESTSIDSYVEDAEEVIKHFSLKDVVVVGHSLGCLVAMTLAAKHPSLVSRLVLYGPIKPPPQAGRDGAKARAEAVRKGGMAAVADTVVGNAFAAKTLKERPEVVAFGRELLSRQNAEGYALACLSLAESKDPDWSAIKADTTIISGSEDKVSNPGVCKAIAELLGHTKVDIVTFEGIGHWHTLENASESVKVLKTAVQP